MASKNYYEILGVPVGASAAGIQSRYRELARRHHPDFAGPTSAERFKEIAEAYQALSDPEQRRIHNEKLGVRSRPAASPSHAGVFPRGRPAAPRARPAAEPLVPPRPAAEPLIPAREPSRRRRAVIVLRLRSR